ncbi:MAG: VOC family protein [Acidobacteriaceae bacterium]|nr:VOC family protein [Acidobacteriaceae bacterium]
MSLFEHNAVTWFEIPTADFERATKFYEAVLDIEFKSSPGEDSCNIFPAGGGVAGCLIYRPGSKPSPDGARVFLNVDGKLDASIRRAQRLGATITVPRTYVPGGKSVYACFLDSEGNHVGLHSRCF